VTHCPFPLEIYSVKVILNNYNSEKVCKLLAIKKKLTIKKKIKDKNKLKDMLDNPLKLRLYALKNYPPVRRITKKMQ
jgi:hypothetical protein